MRLQNLSLLIVLVAAPTWADDYLLEIEQSCTTTGEKIAFKCEKGSHSEIIKYPIFNQNGVWYGRNPSGGAEWKLAVLKEDDYVLVLDNPVFFSGKSIIYIMKRSNSFYWSEFAYSEVLNENEGTVRQGRVLKVRK